MRESTEVVPFPISRLEWPVEGVGLDAALRARPSDRWEVWLRGEWLSSDAGTVRDSDWDYVEGIGRLAIYSESDSSLEAWGLEGGLRWPALRFGPADARVALGIGLGWLRRSLGWEASDGRQWYPCEPWVAHYEWTGPAVRYDLEMDAPFGDAWIEVRGRRWTVEARAAAAPWAEVRDRDDHLLRGILAETRADGSAVWVEASATVSITGSWSLRMLGRYFLVAGEGESRNVVYGGEDPEVPVGLRWSIDEEIEAGWGTVGMSVVWSR